MSLKNIIFFYPSMERGGVTVNLNNLIDYFIKKRIQIDLITNKNFYRKKKVSSFFKIHTFKEFKSFIFSSRVLRGFSAMHELLKLLKTKDKNNTIIFSLQSSMLSILICRIKNFKVIARNSEDPISSVIYAENKFFSFIVFCLRFVIYNLADGILTNSKGSKSSLKYFLFNKNKVKHIYNPYLKEISNLSPVNKKNILLSVGRLCKQKNFKELILTFNEFLKLYPTYKLIIAGDGNEKKMLIELIHELNISKNVKILGWQYNTKKLFLNSKLFILPSLYEGLGNVFIDSINYNVPAIGTYCRSGPSEILLNGKGGFLVPIKDSKKLLEKMIFAIENYDIALKKTKYARRYLNRFHEINCLPLYLKYLKSFF